MSTRNSSSTTSNGRNTPFLYRMDQRRLSELQINIATQHLTNREGSTDSNVSTGSASSTDPHKRSMSSFSAFVNKLGHRSSASSVSLPPDIAPINPVVEERTPELETGTGARVVTPRAVPLTAARLGEIISMLSIATDTTKSVPLVHDPPTDTSNLTARLTAALESCNGTNPAVLISSNGTISTLEQPGNSDLPVAQVVAELLTPGESESAESADTRPPSKTERFKAWWHRNKKGIAQGTALVIGGALIVGIFVISPIAGVIILANVGVLCVAGAGMNASGWRFWRKSDRSTDSEVDPLSPQSMNDDDTLSP